MSITFDARLYSNRTSTSQEVVVEVDEGGYLGIEGRDLQRIHFGDVRVSPRIGNSTRFLELPNDLRLETRANETVDELAGRWIGSYSTLAHRLEKNRHFVAVTILALVVGSFLFVVYGVPALSKVITATLPSTLDDQLGGQVLNQLDDLIFEPTSLTLQRQAELNSVFDSLVPAGDRNFRLEFRDSPVIGANAFALPNAQIVFTDQIVELSEDDEMLAAIMLHEIGHIEYRHSMQAVVRQAGISMLIFVLTGDVNSSATTLITLLPTFLIQSGYSRKLEEEADTYALEQMLARGLDTNKFADMMERMVEEQEDPDRSDLEDNPMLEYFSSHPATQSRIERFREASR